MGQKVNPNSFRMSIKKNWSSKWFNAKNYAIFLAQDITLRNAIKNKLGSNAGVSHVEIERNSQETTINIHTAKPGLIIGRSGQGVNQLKDFLLKQLAKTKLPTNGTKKSIDQKDLISKIKVNIIEVKNPEISANLIAQNIATQLAKRVAYRRAVKMAIEKTKAHREVKGIKINVSGRLGGVEIARREKFINGSIPLSSLRSDIDYAQTDAFTTYGTIGIKVWVYKK